MICRRVTAIAAIMALFMIASAATAAPGKSKPKISRHKQMYGFLPGYRSPARIEWERRRNWRPGYVSGVPQYWYGGPRFYRGRWNGGGFGPCWTKTPIGPVWNCGL